MAHSKVASFPTKGKFEISTFVNPHLFWMIELESESRFKTLQELNKLMEESYRNHPKDSGTTFDVGDIVIAKYRGSLYRAILEYIGTNGSCRQYLCWLIDYGTLVESNTVFKSSAGIRKLLPLSYQASLNNVIYTVEHLDFGKTGEREKTTEFLLSPTPQSFQTSMDVLSAVNSVEFCLEEKDDGIYFGDIMYKDKSGDQKSFRQYLIDKGIVGINKEWFPELKCFINEYKDKNLQLIENICKRSSNPITCKTVCQEIRKKILEEFEEIEVSEEDILRPRRSRVRNSSETGSSRSKIMSDCNHSVTNDEIPENEEVGSLNSSLSQKDVSSDSGSPSSVSRPSKIAALKKKLEEIRASKKEQTTTESSSQVTKDSSSVKGQGRSRINLNDVSKGKMMFCPAGAEPSSFSCQKSVEKPKSTNTTNNRRPKTHVTTCTIRRMSPEQFIHRHAPRGESPDIVDESPPSGRNPPKENEETEDSSTTDNRSTVSARCVSQMKVKPYCSCKQCHNWTNAKSWEPAGEFEKYKPKVFAVLV
nr:unnamed protein product [Callosobruchus analis]